MWLAPLWICFLWKAGRISVAPGTDSVQLSARLVTTSKTPTHHNASRSVSTTFCRSGSLGLVCVITSMVMPEISCMCYGSVVWINVFIEE